MVVISDAVAERLGRQRERGWLVFVARWFLIWGAAGAVLCVVGDLIVGGSVREQLLVRRFVAYGLFGTWIATINWHIGQHGYSRWLAARAGGAVTGAAWADRHRLAIAVVLIVALVAWAFGGVVVLAPLDDRVEAHLEQGRVDDVQMESRWLLAVAQLYPLSWAHGNAIMHGHTALGLHALEAGDVAAAREHLLAAGRTPGSPQLDTFGPNMLLAKSLLEHGEPGVVLTYFAECRTFWRMDEGQLDAWSAAVEAGEVPDFGANLAF